MVPYRLCNLVRALPLPYWLNLISPVSVHRVGKVGKAVQVSAVCYCNKTLLQFSFLSAEVGKGAGAYPREKNFLKWHAPGKEKNPYRLFIIQWTWSTK